MDSAIPNRIPLKLATLDTFMTHKKISDEDRDIFQKAVSDVKPLKSSHRDMLEKKNYSLQKFSLKAKDESRNERKIIFDFHDQQPQVDSEDIISFTHTGVQHKRSAQLRRGKICAESTLDLHRHTVDEAIYATENFIKHCQNSGFRVVCIIHGKGNYSADNKPVIKNLLNNYLRSHAAVLAFHSAKGKQGGAGALYVLLKLK